MTKKDKQELQERLARLDYWTRLGLENAINMGVASKRDTLAELREAAKLDKVDDDDTLQVIMFD